jgi:predicted nucleic acid-binding protein
VLTTIPDGVVCYLDATIFYYHLVDAPPLSDDCSDLLLRIAQDRVQGVTSSVAIAEATHKVMLVVPLSQAYFSGSKAQNTTGKAAFV